MKVLTLVPARMGSSRFPGKPLAQINGVPMVGHVIRRVGKSRMSQFSAVATCDVEIRDYVESIGHNTIMTSASHERASDRCAEALHQAEQKCGCTFDVVIMVQGDEPLVHPNMLEESLTPFKKDKSTLVSNLYSVISNRQEFEDPNCIKVVLTKNDTALYMSRSPIPHWKSENTARFGYKQVCIIPFARDFLIEYSKLPPTSLEIQESIDMLRVLENGLDVHMVKTNYLSIAVDHPEDITRVEKALADSAVII